MFSIVAPPPLLKLLKSQVWVFIDSSCSLSCTAIPSTLPCNHALLSPSFKQQVRRTGPVLTHPAPPSLTATANLIKRLWPCSLQTHCLKCTGCSFFLTATRKYSIHYTCIDIWRPSLCVSTTLHPLLYYLTFIPPSNMR